MCVAADRSCVFFGAAVLSAALFYFGGMNMKIKRILASLLAVLMLAGFAPLTVSAKASIPSNAKIYNGHTYVVYYTPKTWTDAEAYCEKLGGHLVTITNANENAFVTSIIVNITSYEDCYCIGAYNAAAASDSQKGHVRWSDPRWITNEKMTYENWNSTGCPINPCTGIPDGHICNYGYIWRTTGKWTSWGDDLLHPDRDYYGNIECAGFICEWDYTVGKVHSVTVDDMTINYKSSDTLRPEIKADSGVKYTVKYESLNPAVVTVDQYGNIDGIKKGVADIKVTVTDESGNTVSDTCTVTVSYSTVQWIIIIVFFGWIWY